MLVTGETYVHGDPSVTSFTTNSPRTGLGSNQDFLGGKSTTNNLYHGRSVIWDVVALESSFFMPMKLFKPFLS
jgi:hypothetical protein